MPYGLPWSEAFIRQLADREGREEYVADQVRARISLMIRALRDERGWSQAKLGEMAGKPQNVISRLENPDYGKPSLETLLEVAAAFGLPLFIDIPEWEDWFRQMSHVPSSKNFHRRSFDAERMAAEARHAQEGTSSKNVIHLVAHQVGAASLFAGPRAQQQEASVQSHAAGQQPAPGAPASATVGEKIVGDSLVGRPASRMHASAQSAWLDAQKKAQQMPDRIPA